MSNAGPDDLVATIIITIIIIPLLMIYVPFHFRLFNFAFSFIPMGLGSFLEIPVEFTHAFRSCMHAFNFSLHFFGAFTVTLQPHPLIRLVLTLTSFWLNSRGEGLGLLHVFTHLAFFLP